MRHRKTGQDTVYDSVTKESGYSPSGSPVAAVVVVFDASAAAMDGSA